MDRDKRKIRNIEETNSIEQSDNDELHDWVMEYQQPFQLPRELSEDPVRAGVMIGDDGSLVIGGQVKKPPLSTKAAAMSGLNFLKDSS